MADFRIFQKRRAAENAVASTTTLCVSEEPRRCGAEQSEDVQRSSAFYFMCWELLSSSSSSSDHRCTQRPRVSKLQPDRHSLVCRDSAEVAPVSDPPPPTPTTHCTFASAFSSAALALFSEAEHEKKGSALYFEIK